MDIGSIEELEDGLAAQRYIADRGLATALFLALTLQRPLLLEGEPGVGKTEVAKVLARLLDTGLIRLQCYEGLDVSQAVYEWNYSRQIMHIRYLEANQARVDEAELFGPEFLLRRPLLRALEESREQAQVLLIDEVDRSDEEFEAYLLELLSDYQLSIPELGTIAAVNRPVIILTSNRTRELHDALKRRCLYAWIDYPDFEKELTIVRTRVPAAATALARQATAVVQAMRTADLYKTPGVAETIDWTTALVALNRQALDEETVRNTLGVILKTQEDLQIVQDELLPTLYAQAMARL